MVTPNSSLWTHPVIVSTVVGALVVAELAYRSLVLRRVVSIRDTFDDAAIFSVDIAWRTATLGGRLWLFDNVHRLAPWRLEISVVTIACAYVAIDFIYYWKHRLFHRSRLGWALHMTHHSSETLTFLATFRVNWLESTLGYFFFVPVVMVGVDPLLVLLLIEINDGWQFVCHTELVNPRWLDGWFNTPNVHRVHHARDPELADTNYGSTFMVWDRMFGTYRGGSLATEVGLSGHRRLGNVWMIEFAGLIDWVREGWRRVRAPRADSRSELR